ncbi:phenazine biosynthesis protein PhzF [Rhizocola hellebori]|uniref:Phenazine biosynthesis protein PhzF n=1 Tax=Rhizocola hellebori TaxID=1392758 RepID=A0A8J3QAD2_9ACTN|nr:PhzF family phenazine biosynthesis protein [Rhizocola hellebori]GIH06098.1 phenazine biosynthesis protein PhzF [Rhizocola hellebori]
MQYHHVDVFSSRPYSGNSLAVFAQADGLTGAQMAQITKELRHFESIFLVPQGPMWTARVFDLLDELDFAGHPVIGAACVLHALHGLADEQTWTIQLKARTVGVTTRRGSRGRYTGVLDQGPAAFLGRPDSASIASWFSLRPSDLDPDLPPEIVSTGLRYLVLPVRGTALESARITIDLGIPLDGIGAQFAYLLDARQMEGRHWNNDGVVEDVATGSGAGCAAAYLRRHGRIGDGEAATLHQGRFTGRPSQMTIAAFGEGEDIRSVHVGGDVVFVGTGRLRELPQ